VARLAPPHPRLRSRERKVERISSLQADVDRLRCNNFVLLKCVEEVATRALTARADRARLQVGGRALPVPRG
jgi:hypothetical protein